MQCERKQYACMTVHCGMFFFAMALYSVILPRRRHSYFCSLLACRPM